MNRLTSLKIKGWKSIREAEILFGNISILIGANGSGKSSLLSYFGLLDLLLDDRFQEYVVRAGGANAIFHYGVKQTQKIVATMAYENGEIFGLASHTFAAAAPDNLMIDEDAIEIKNRDGTRLFNGVAKSTLEINRTQYRLAAGSHVSLSRSVLPICRDYQFHDTSYSSPIRRTQYINDNSTLHADGGNVSSILHRYKVVYPTIYENIVRTIRHAFPQFHDFDLQKETINANSILLNWREKQSSYLFGPHQFSDGTLRLIALITLLMQPSIELPDVIIIDEPELGLHPNAIGIVASLIRSASTKVQFIIATQSVPFVNEFESQDIVVVDRKDNATQFSKLNSYDLSGWLEDFRLGELWQKNVIGGGPY